MSKKSISMKKQQKPFRYGDYILIVDCSYANKLPKIKLLLAVTTYYISPTNNTTVQNTITTNSLFLLYVNGTPTTDGRPSGLIDIYTIFL